MEKRGGTIIACSSGTGNRVALALIRISGFKNLEEFFPCFGERSKELRPRVASLCKIVDDGRIIDSVIATFFPAPHSYSGENMLELSVHGNPLNVKRIITLFNKKGKCRLAYPGEFSFRAYCNGKLSLAQAEGLELFLRADSILMLNQGMELLQGELHQKYIQLHQTFLQLKGSMALMIDFMEDVGEEQAQKNLKEKFVSLTKQVDFLHKRSRGDVSALLSPQIVLFGKTNGGKSSLFNYLLENPRSIISPQAGTTRDFVTEYINYKDVSYCLVDTAGIWPSSTNPVDIQATKKSVEILKKAFFKILVVNPNEWESKDLPLVEKEHFDLLIFTHVDKSKIDLPREDVLPKFNLFSTISLAPDSLGEAGSKGVADHFGQDKCHEGLIMDAVEKKYRQLAKENPLLIQRHGQIIEELYGRLREISSLLDLKEKDVGILDSEISCVEGLIQSLIGTIAPDDVLNAVFDNFCIGK